MTDENGFDKMMEEIVAKIMEHGDSCRIFVTCHDGDNDLTRSYSIGKGNFCAQRGQIAEWMERQNQYEREKAKQDANEDEQ